MKKAILNESIEIAKILKIDKNNNLRIIYWMGVI